MDAAARYVRATAAERDYASVLARAPRHAYGGQCAYCGHCAPCSQGIDIAMVQKLYDLAVACRGGNNRKGAFMPRRLPPARALA